MKTSILGKLENLAEHHHEISALLADAETIADQDRYRQLSMEYAQLTPVVNNFRDWQQAQDDISSAGDMLQDPDPDMQAMAQEELAVATARSEELELELQKLLLPKDPHDNSNIFLEIRAGTGGESTATSSMALTLARQGSQVSRWARSRSRSSPDSSPRA